MTKLLQCLHDELVRRDYAASTIRSYVQIVDAFRQHTGARLDRITPAQLRRYHLFLLEERRLDIGTVVTQISALRFFCRHVLQRRVAHHLRRSPRRSRQSSLDRPLQASAFESHESSQTGSFIGADTDSFAPRALSKRLEEVCQRYTKVANDTPHRLAIE